MTRPFYSNPLAAALMEMLHGVQTENRENGYYSSWQVLYYEADIRRDGSIPADYGHRFYVCPDSLGLLAVRVGDVILSDTGIVATVVPDGTLQDNTNAVCLSDVPMFGRVKPPVIIFRDGKHFFFPECEP